MNNFGLFLLATIVVTAKSYHMFFGTSVLRPMVHYKNAEYSSELFQKRVEEIYYKLEPLPNSIPRTIQGVMAYDKTKTTASANVTQGGLGYDFIKIRMKSERGEKLHYEIYIYA